MSAVYGLQKLSVVHNTSEILKMCFGAEKAYPPIIHNSPSRIFVDLCKRARNTRSVTKK